ncbi:MAG TPA: flagellar FliJ family protein [Polyangiaceae bacterium]
MNDERRDKLKRLMDLRSKQLNSTVSNLSTARTRQTELERRLEEAKRKRLAALTQRRSRAGDGVSAAEWQQAENWLLGLTEQEWKAKAQNEAAAKAVTDARNEVTRAKREQDKIQLLLNKLGAEAKEAEARALRKFEDDLLASQLATKGRNAEKAGR